MDKLDKHFHAVAKALGRGEKARLGEMTREERDKFGFLDHSIDCRDFGIDDDCPICDPKEKGA